MINSNKKYGFTLMELMVAVIIIAVLAAVAVPQYKKAVLKSRFSTLMPLAQSVAKGNEVYYLANGEYADRKDKLDVEGPGTTPEGTQVNVVDSEDYNYVIASRNSLPNKYIVYQAHSPKFAGNIHCEAEDKNTPAMELCKSLGGQEIGGSQTDGYVTYVLEGTYGEDDTLPTSFTKLKEEICANISPEDCIVNGQTITTRECTGTLPSGHSQTCINKTYSDTGALIDYESASTVCGAFSNLAWKNATICTTTFKDKNNSQTGRTEEICNLKAATWENGVCTWTSGGGDWYNYDETKGDKRRYYTYTCHYDACTGETKRYTELEGNVTTFDGNVYYASLNGEKVVFAPSSDTYWSLPTQNLKTTVSQIPATNYLSPSGNVIFTTTNTQTNEVTNTVTCAYSDADWEHGTCKPGTAI